MSVLFQTVINTGKLYSFRKTFSNVTSYNCVVNRRYSENVRRKFTSFDEVTAHRRAEARRSLVVQVNSESSFNELHGYCSKYALINGIHHYENSADEHFMLIEFNTEEDLKDVLRTCSAHQKDLEVMVLQSPFLWFRAVAGKKEKFAVPNQSLISKDGTMLINENALSEKLLNCRTVSEQIQVLYDKTALNELSVRLRYIAARQLEVIFESLYSNVSVRPFGSSVNGFGRMGCDLDLVLTNVLTEEMSNTDKRLVYQEKRFKDERGPWQRHMQLVAEVLELRVPGAARVRRILHARVPIVKYAHELAGLDCDLCCGNMSGVYMSELLWLYGSLDPRVRPLTFVVRRWAQTMGLTNPNPGRWVTNFSLTLMVLFFLQQKSQEGRVLPSLKYLVEKAGKEDLRIAEDNLNCTFLRDLNQLPTSSYGQNPSNLETLLLQFFEFYSQFDFQDKAISIYEGAPVRKTTPYPLQIVNPLDQAMNVSRNVIFDECERIKLEIRNAAWQIESSSEGEKRDDWGLLGLVEKRTSRDLKKLIRVGNSHRLVSVKDLFSDKEKQNGEGFRSKIKRLIQKSDTEVEESVKEMQQDLVKDEKKEQRMKFKNSQTASEVYRIRRNKMI